MMDENAPAEIPAPLPRMRDQPGPTPGAPFVVWSGSRFVNVANLRAADLEIADIAQGLAAMPRWAGKTDVPFSVAQHSLFVLRLLEDGGDFAPDALAAGLLHDAAETFLGDIPAPIKQGLGFLCRIERDILRKVAARWELRARDFKEPWLVAADRMALAAEARALLPAAASARMRLPGPDVELPAELLARPGDRDFWAGEFLAAAARLGIR